MYKVKYDDRAIKTLSKMDANIRKLILAYISKHIDNVENPRAVGKSLKGSLSGLWRYRVGNYRILANIKDSEVTVYVFKIGHRKDVYQ